jgi:hypothetical protein
VCEGKENAEGPRKVWFHKGLDGFRTLAQLGSWRFQAVLCDLACGRLSEGQIRIASIVSRYLSKRGQTMSVDWTNWNRDGRAGLHRWDSAVREASLESEGERGCCAGQYLANHVEGTGQSRTTTFW